MQIKKDQIKNKIITCAQSEFFKNGFKNTSMRTIATKAQVSLSNIYNYFKDKDEILEAVLTPLLRYFDYLNLEHNKPENIGLDVFHSETYKQKHITLYTELITRFRNELTLLLFHAYGSKYENFREEFTDKQMQLGKTYIKLLKDKNPELNTDVSDFFIHTASTWQLNIIGEIVFHKLPDAEIGVILDNCFTFSIAGWEKLLTR